MQSNTNNIKLGNLEAKVADQGERIAGLDSKMENLTNDVAQLNRAITAYTDRINTHMDRINDRITPKYGALFGGFTAGSMLLFTLIAAVGKAYIDPLVIYQKALDEKISLGINTFERLNDEVETFKVQMYEQRGVHGAFASRVDETIKAIDKQTDTNYHLISELAVELEALHSEQDKFAASTTEKLREIETQFDWSTNAVTTLNSYTNRITALLWKKVYGEDLPPLNSPTIGPNDSGNGK